MKHKRICSVFALVSLFAFAATLTGCDFSQSNAVQGGDNASLDAIIGAKEESVVSASDKTVSSENSFGKAEQQSSKQFSDKEVQIDEKEYTEGLWYTRYDGYYSVSGMGIATEKEIVIPAVYNGLPVTTITPWAFCGANIVSVTLPETVTTVGDGAFSFCASLKSVDLSNVQTMGDYVFRDCYSLETVTTGISSTLGDRTFWYCNNLTSVEFSATVDGIGAWTFYECDNLGSVSFGGNSVGEGAFWGCDSLTQVTYNGTYAEWLNVEKGNWWSQDAAFDVACSDGLLTKDGFVPYETELPDELPDEEEATWKELVVTQSHQNSLENGTGTMLWTVSVSFGGKNALELLEEDGLYLVYYISYGDAYGDLGWYAFDAEFSVAHHETGATVLYCLPTVTKSMKFAVVKKAPSDSAFGGYSAEELTDSDFLFVSEVYNNPYFVG